MRRIFGLVGIALGTLAVVLAGFAHAAGTGAGSILVTLRQTNDSMAPTVLNGWTLLIETNPYQGGRPIRGDVIQLRYPYDRRFFYLKRVIGLPGDHVVIAHGGVYINGRRLVEPYLAAPIRYVGCPFCDVTVPSGDVYVLGDNRNASSDSHAWGFVPFADISGRVLAVTPHPAGLRLLNSPAYAGLP